MRFVVGLALGCALGACSSDASLSPDAPGPSIDAPPADANLTNTDLLSISGLYSDFAHRTIDPRFRTYEPLYPLWADGLGKRRFLDLPAGTKIDTSDMDHWSFPVGTRFWKEFAKPDGTPLETRLIVKTGASSWSMGAYVWRDDGSDADYTEDGATAVRGTDHDVPSGDQCVRCHFGEPGRFLGFSAIQLGDAVVNSLANAHLLTSPPTVGQTFLLPWEPTTNAALGLFHGNCGHCHSDVGSASTATQMRLRLNIADLAGDKTLSTPWKSIIGAPTDSFMPGTGLDRVAPGDTTHSAILVRMSSRSPSIQMPPIATVHVDTTGVAAVMTWVNGLPH